MRQKENEHKGDHDNEDEEVNCDGEDNDNNKSYDSANEDNANYANHAVNDNKVSDNGGDKKRCSTQRMQNEAHSKTSKNPNFRVRTNNAETLMKSIYEQNTEVAKDCKGEYKTFSTYFNPRTCWRGRGRGTYT